MINQIWFMWLFLKAGFKYSFGLRMKPFDEFILDIGLDR